MKPAGRKKKYVKPVVRGRGEHKDLKELAGQWVKLRKALRPMEAHSSDFKISIGGISEKVRTYNPGAGNVEAAREKLEKVEAEADPLIRDMLDTITAIEIKQEQILGVLGAILRHPKVTKEQIGKADEAVRGIGAKRTAYKKIYDAVDLCRQALVRKRGVLLDRELRLRKK